MATSALIRVGGKGSWRGSAGVRDLESGRKVLENARLRAGSTTKVVTAAVVLQLVAEGGLDLDGTVQSYLPGLLGDAFEPVTVRQLLSYTSGLQGGRTLGDTVDEEYPHLFETLPPEEVVPSGVAKGPLLRAGRGAALRQHPLPRARHADREGHRLYVRTSGGDTGLQTGRHAAHLGPPRAPTRASTARTSVATRT